MNVAEYEAMYRVEDDLWWYTGMRQIAASVLGRVQSAKCKVQREDAGGYHLGFGSDGRGRGGLTILDAGCGTGGNLRWLSRFGRAYGVDLSPQAVYYCSQRRLHTVARASVLALPFPDAYFDLVTSFDVIYHVGVADDVQALREMRRVLKPGGRALVRVPAIEQLRSAHDAAVHTRQRYTLGEVASKARQAELEVERATYANTLLFPLAAVARLGKRFSGGATQASDVRPVAPPVNAALGAILRLEAALVRRVDLPIGLSAVVVVRRPE